MHICAGIEYETRDTLVSSDLCFDSDIVLNATREDRVAKKHRKVLHDALDEWLDRSEGSGLFFVGERSSDPKPFTYLGG